MTYTTDGQITLEKLMAELGRQRYWARIETAKKNDRQADTTAGRYLLRVASAQMYTALKAWHRKAVRKPGPSHSVASYLNELKHGSVAFLVVRAALDSIGQDNSLLKTAYSVGNILESEARFVAIARADRRVWGDLKKRMRRAHNDVRRRGMIRDVVAKLQVEFESWPKRDKMRLGIVMLELLKQNTKLIDIHRITLPRGRTRNVIVATEETLQWIEKSNVAHEAMFPFWLPSVVPPADWENVWDGGYHTNLVERRPLIKTRDRKMLGEIEASDMTEVYAAVNILQRTRWQINPRVYEVMHHFWSRGTPIADLPLREDEPAPVRPSELDLPEHDPEILKQYKKALSMRRQNIVANRSKRVLSSKIMFMAEHFQDQAFYFPYQADFRGRLYTVPYFLQPQGPSQARGLLQFADGRKPDADGIEWLGIHGANCFGVDKVSFDARLDWVGENEARILAVAEDPIGNRWWADASKPWEFLAFCFEWAEYTNNPEGFVSKIPVAMDGSNNGLQIFSLLLRDRKGAEATNCVPSETPRDIYQDVADIVTEKLRAADTDMANKWLEFIDGRLPREATKRSVMTLPYGSTFHACIHYTRDWYEETRKKRGGATPFERGYESSVYLARLIWDAITSTVASARHCMDWLREVATIFAQHKQPVRWTSPTGFPVKQGYYRYKTKEFKTVVGDRVRWSKYREDVDNVSVIKQKNGISPNFIHSLDAAALVKTVKLANDAGIDSFAMIHDSYGVLAADASRMARVLREVYAELFSDNLLERLHEELKLYLPGGVTLPAPPESGDLDVNEVKNSPYFFA